MKDYTDKIAVVTGSASGMGRSYALELAARGAVLALTDRDVDGLEETVALLPAGTRTFTPTNASTLTEETHA